MPEWNSFFSQWTPRLLSVLRIVTAFLFMAHGSQKLLGYPPALQPRPGPMSTLSLIAGILELFGGAFVLLGLFTRPVAFILSGQMAVAYFMSHAPQGFWPILNRGELAAIYSFVFLYFFAAGGGSWSLDQLLQRRRRSA